MSKVTDSTFMEEAQAAYAKAQELSTELQAIKAFWSKYVQEEKCSASQKCDFKAPEARPFATQRLTDDELGCPRITLAQAHADFDKYVQQHRPVIIAGITGDVTPIKAASSRLRSPLQGVRVNLNLDSLSEEASEQPVEVSLPDSQGQLGQRQPSSRWANALHKAGHGPMAEVGPQVMVRPPKTVMRFGDFLRLTRLGNIQLYLHQSNIDLTLPSLKARIKPPPFATMKMLLREVNLWIGNGNLTTHMHFDHYDNIYTVIQGTKDFLLFRPAEKPKLYYQPQTFIFPVCDPFDASGSYSVQGCWEQMRIEGLKVRSSHSHVNMSAPDFAQHPRYKQARPVRCKVQAGDGLYIPSFWNHAVKSDHNKGELSIAVNHWYMPQPEAAFFELAVKKNPL